MKQIRFSKQRQAIYKALCATKEHPTADQIYQLLKPDNPGLSLGTVYRNLNFLVDNQQIIKIDIGDNVDHFDADTQAHYHFVCKKCNRLLDLDVPYDTNIIKNIQNESEHQILSHSIVFEGYCKQCKDEKTELKGEKIL